MMSDEVSSPRATGHIGMTSMQRKNLAARRREKLIRFVTCVVAGIMIWGYVDSRRTEEKEFKLDLHVSIPDGWLVEGEPLPKQVSVSVRGPRQVMAALALENWELVKTVVVPEDWKEPEYSQDLQLESRDVRNFPPELSVRVLAPLRLPLRLTRLVTKYLPVEPVITGKPEEGYTVDKATVRVEPNSVEVHVPRNWLDPTDTIKTEPIDVSGQKYFMGATVGLQPFVKNSRSLKVEKGVYVSVELPEVPSRRVLQEPVPVRALTSLPLDAAKNARLEPAAVKVTVSGPELLVSKLKPEEITVYVDTREMALAGKSEFMLKCKAIAPDKILIVGIEPDSVKWILSEEPAHKETTQ
jgi:hypothetical protein